MRESPDLDTYLREIEHTCNIYCEPPVHYATLRGTWVKGPLITPPKDSNTILLAGLAITFGGLFGVLYALSRFH